MVSLPIVKRQVDPLYKSEPVTVITVPGPTTGVLIDAIDGGGSCV
jgi:hypothetical protein